MEQLSNFVRIIREFLDSRMIRIGESSASIGSLLSILLAFIVLVFVARLLRRWLVHRLLVRSGSEIGSREAVATIAQYLLVGLGGFTILQVSGLDLSALALIAGTLGVGIGLGLQSITNNFVSGLIILFERPIKVGDRIDVGDTAGNVRAISLRATTIVNNDNISVIVPNSEFITSRVINWSHSDRLVRLSLDVGVSYDSDPAEVRDVLLAAARDCDGVLETPTPDVIFRGFGDSALDFQLRTWTSAYMDRPQVLRSQLYFAIFERLRARGIEIPFPQRVVHVRPPRPAGPGREEPAAARDEGSAGRPAPPADGH
jgi:small-conductance mechanosensitive channel